jgi:hypothetical protein
MIGKGLTANAIEVEGLCLILGAVLSLTWKDYRNPRDTSFYIVGIRAEARVWYLGVCLRKICREFMYLILSRLEQVR